jgi:hypothetical protein
VGHLPGQEVVGDCRQRVDIRALVDAATRGLLRRHVRRRPDDVGQPARVQDRLGDAQVGHHHSHPGAVGAQEEVGGLDVAVDRSLGVEHRQPCRGLAHERDGAIQREGVLALEEVRDRPLVGVRHHEVRRAVGLAHVVDPDDEVGVGSSQDARLLEEPVADVEALGPVVRERLHRDVGLQLVVAIEPHRGEPADPESLHLRQTTQSVRQGHDG